VKSLVSNNSLIFEKMRKQKIDFSGFPTPLQTLPHLSKVLNGPKIFVKRDDMTDIAFGGNKARKIEFLFADAKQKNADVVISVGAVQSNCACMVASAARRLGIKPVLVLVGKEPDLPNGNLLLDKILSAEIHFVDDYGSHIEIFMDKLAEEHKMKGNNPYIVPAGASMSSTVPGYALAMEELILQFNQIGESIDYVICACGTGGTQAGLIFGKKLLNAKLKILGTSVFASKIEAQKTVSDLVNCSAELFDVNLTIIPNEVNIFDNYIKDGYGVINKEVINAIKLVANYEGIFLDPVYTGKAMVMLIDLINKGYFNKDDNVVFFHTGGLPALFLYRKELGLI
jgi:D-cysteine desulfhydrase family pyridoxal phosphate-dependent enzyme